MRLCSTLFASAFGSHAATYKKHLWFDHGCDDLMAAGNPAEYSTSMFKSEYRLLKRGLRLGNTRAPAKTAFILHIEKQLITHELRSRTHNGNEDLRGLYEEMTGVTTSHHGCDGVFLKNPVEAVEWRFEFRALRNVGCSRFLWVHNCY
ncbi:hypothetical protein ANCCAN_26238 [Ancylostoma caninum]|uniref:Uncharacterized protein n=1 Tax=Ancylostoma caninum TaxID=29170 RepID=A0A368FB26_ANCCA|nr:hypothetical protein ANCCAN_26238 [Ancylostoma caninum]